MKIIAIINIESEDYDQVCHMLNSLVGNCYDGVQMDNIEVISDKNGHVLQSEMDKLK